ncbi:nucleoside hydrolase-like [Physella acuta]|uniref:nucleoside hydrolase-like n=1 Tax=Physella acuta TaxID=109671 RepID=UPI0027DC0A88|nr:nucleoside hydrolase-like [Physella acuta]
MSIIKLDQEFSSYDEVEEKIQELQDKEKFRLWKRDSRTIAAAIKRMPRRTFNPDVKYNELLYCCVKGGREKKDDNRSMRQRCPYQIKFRCTSDGQRLKVVAFTTKHNHDPMEFAEVEMEKAELSPVSSPSDDDDLIDNSDIKIEELDESILDQLSGAAEFSSSSHSNRSTKIISNGSYKYPKLRVILDVDTGIDDSHAIMLALAHPNVEILAITCCNGNVNVDLVCQNTLRVLQACGRGDIPVYRGAECSLLGNTSQFENFSGEAWNTPVDSSVLQPEHAANAMIRIINSNPGEVTVVALAPLTNLALAMRLDSTVGRKIKDLYIMGGNIEARGRISTCAEFNFYNDPEAAQVVLKEFINITILPYEVCRKFHLSWDFFDLWTNSDSPVSEFVKRSVLESAKPARAAGREGYRSCDGYCMSLVVDRSVVQSAEPVYCTVELSGQLTRGQMVVDWDGLLQQPCNALVVKELDIEKIKSLFMLMVRPQQEAPPHNAGHVHNKSGYNTFKAENDSNNNI